MSYYLCIGPVDGDVLGDQWGSHVRKVWELMEAKHPELTGVDYKLWQWAQCELSGNTSRVVASPTAMLMAGVDFDIYRVEVLLQLSNPIIEEYTGVKK